MNKFTLFRIPLLSVLIACTSDYIGELPNSEPFPVLNGVLYADSAFAFQLTWSNQPKEKEFEPITDASIIVKKNGVQIDPRYVITRDGRYISDDTCKNRDSYAIEIRMLKHSPLSSETIIPDSSSIDLSKVKSEGFGLVYDLRMADIAPETHAIYVFLFLEQCDSQQNQIWHQSNIYCSSAYCDAFNRYYDSWPPKVFLLNMNLLYVSPPKAYGVIA